MVRIILRKREENILVEHHLPTTSIMVNRIGSIPGINHKIKVSEPQQTENEAMVFPYEVIVEEVVWVPRQVLVYVVEPVMVNVVRTDFETEPSSKEKIKAYWNKLFKRKEEYAIQA